MSDCSEDYDSDAPRPIKPPPPEVIAQRIKDDPLDIDLGGLRIFSLDEIREALEEFATATHTISMKRNLLHELTPLPQHIAHSLRVLDLYDNKIYRISNLGHLASITRLDLSYNNLSRIEGLEALVNLEELYLVENKISKIEGLNTLKKLRVLELGGNRIRTVPKEALEGLTSLEALYLGKNKLTAVCDLSGLPNLKTVSLQANRFRAIPAETFANCRSIEQVFIGENGIEAIDPEPLANLKNLKVLDISMNPIASLTGVERIAPETLKEFWCTNAKIASFEEVQRLAEHKSLETVFLEQNPIQQKENRYRWRVGAVLPQVKMIDLAPITSRVDQNALDKQ